ncbi:MAG: arginine deiminase family protein, partial [Dethiobacteria bacterium]
MEIKVNSEIGKLKAVMLHPPGKEITRLTPSNMKALLWDNIPWPERALEEHQNYVKELEKRGAKVYLTPDLLKDVIKDRTLRDELIEKSVAYEEERLTPETLQVMQDYMKSVNDDQLIDIFMGGITKQELYQETHGVAFEDLADYANEFCLTPMTNIGWSRDPAATIGNGIAFSHMYGRAREREPLYVKYVFKYHPEFKDLDYHVWYGLSEDDQTNLEGGNVFPLSKNVLAIGFNERTAFRTIMKLADRLMEKSEVTDVLALQFDNKKIVEGDVGMFVHVDT